MKLTLEGLKNKQDWEAAGIKLPSYDIEKVAENTKKAPVWVHFGAGNIFRIFIGGLADALLEKGEADKGITCVETFDFDVVDKIYEPYDNLVLAVTFKSRWLHRQKSPWFSYRSNQSSVQCCRRMEPLKRNFRKPCTADNFLYHYRKRLCFKRS